jgi:hypothetical protein
MRLMCGLVLAPRVGRFIGLMNRRGPHSLRECCDGSKEAREEFPRALKLRNRHAETWISSLEAQR